MVTGVCRCGKSTLQLLKTLGKNYIIDLGFRNMHLGYRDEDWGHTLENVTFLELLCRDYRVSIGKIGETMADEATRERELRPLQLMNDNYEKIVLSMDRSFMKSYEGIKAANIIDFLLEELPRASRMDA